MAKYGYADKSILPGLRITKLYKKKKNIYIYIIFQKSKANAFTSYADVLPIAKATSRKKLLLNLLFNAVFVSCAKLPPFTFNNQAKY